MLEELQRWLSLGAFERMPKGRAKNVIDTRLGGCEIPLYNTSQRITQPHLGAVLTGIKARLKLRSRLHRPASLEGFDTSIK